MEIQFESLAYGALIDTRVHEPVTAEIKLNKRQKLGSGKTLLSDRDWVLEAASRLPNHCGGSSGK